MKIAVVGAGAMGSVFGGQLAQAGNEVTLIDTWSAAVEAINANGLRIDDKSGNSQVVRLRAVTDAAEVGGPADLVLIFVKCYHTEPAVRSLGPLLRDDTVVLSLQNGWGNHARIAGIVGKERVMVGLTYHSSTVLGPGHVLHAGRGPTFVGEIDGRESARLSRVADTLAAANFDVTASPTILKEIWSKLALNVCTLPTSALLRFQAHQLIEHQGTLELMRSLLRETVAVARAQKIELDEDERWEAITGLLKRAVGAKSSMLQDVEKSRPTEIDVVNGAIVAAGREFDVPTPFNEAMVWSIKSLEESYAPAAAASGAA